MIAWFTHNAKLRLIANCRLRDHSRITHYPFTQSLQKLPLPPSFQKNPRNHPGLYILGVKPFHGRALWLDRASQLPLLATWKAASREPRYAGSAGILPAWGRHGGPNRQGELPKPRTLPKQAIGSATRRSQGRRCSQGEAFPSGFALPKFYLPIPLAVWMIKSCLPPTCTGSSIIFEILRIFSPLRGGSRECMRTRLY